jgi:hypothetical protein
VRHHSFHQSSQADPFLSLQLADFFVLWLMPNRNEGPCYFVFMSIMFVIIVGSQLFWMCRIGKVGKKLISRKSWRTGLAVAGLLVYIFLLAFNLFSGINRGSSWNFRAELLEAPFEIWFVGSVLGFFVIMLLWNVDRLARVVIEIAKKFAIPSHPGLQSPLKAALPRASCYHFKRCPLCGRRVWPFLWPPQSRDNSSAHQIAAPPEGF